jgi:hypothetical protein
VTAETGWEHIEPPHICIGLCSLDQVLRPQVLTQLRLTEEEIVALRVERNLMRDLLERFQVDSLALRLLLRQQQGRGNGSRLSSIIRRSQPTRQAFAEAETMAARASVAMIDVALLFAALLADRTGLVTTVLHTQGTDVETLQREAFMTARLPLARRPWRPRQSQQRDAATEEFSV